MKIEVLNMIYSPSLEILYKGDQLTFGQKMKAAHDLGFTAYEFWAWWNKDLTEIVELQQQLGMKAASFCAKFISLVDPSQRSAFLEGLEQSVEAAIKLDCKFLIAQTGKELEGVPRAAQQESVIEGLRACVPVVAKHGITLIVEPLNTLVDHKGYYLQTSEEAVHIINEVNSEHVKVLYDIYHQQITEGNLIPNITSYYDSIGYFHLADHPGRHEPGTGEINYINVLAAIKRLGYNGYIGMEYAPMEEASESLNKFMREYS
jgi:hydroxypyruvate isomerase